MNQVEGHVDIFRNILQSTLHEEVYFYDLEIWRIELGYVESVLVSYAADHFMSVLEKDREKPLRDISGYPGEENLHGLHANG